ncbi:hypothetical protein FA95DRAFT_1605986 [Auriscalpium vulgare]|uniref:Uncharacterized protein n=1 Tax=Auriscalpium vulgare TaxID=40419 RepID=A0ACB8RUK6_9AGAM|nr:hypothetical protein FA95DRAFT_1605986 [Auriscalpium vulgare]
MNTQFIFGDAIVVWRLWVIWSHSWRIVVGPLVLLFCTSAVILAQLAQMVVTIISCASGRSQAVCIGERGRLWDFHPVKLYFASLVLTLITNGVATGLIAYRAWIHHRYSQAVHIRMGRDSALAVLPLLVESGALYCAFWLSMVILWPVASTQQPGLYSFINLFPQLTGIYTTVIIVICAMRRSYADTAMSAPENITELQFATYGQPAAPATRRPHFRGEERSLEFPVGLSGDGRSFTRGSISSVEDLLEVTKTA